MLEDIIPAAAGQLRSTPLGSHLDAFCASLSDRGYCAQTIREKVRTVARLSRWMAAKRLVVVHLDERRVDEFICAQRRSHLLCLLSYSIRISAKEGYLATQPQARTPRNPRSHQPLVARSC